jgi:two-component system sensor histidine kinase KdpD
MDKRPAENPPSVLVDYALAAGSAAAVTLLCRVLDPYLAATNLAMLYLLGAAAVASRGHRGPSILYSVLAVLCLDFFFIPPRLSFTVADSQYLVTFAVMLSVALLISTLSVRLRDEAQSARRAELRAETLRDLSQRLAGTRGVEPTLQAGTRHLSEVFDAEVAALVPGEDGSLSARAWSGREPALAAKEMAVATWVFGSGRPAGLGTATLPVSTALCAPLLGSSGPVGVLRVEPRRPESLLDPERLLLLDAFANQIALALEADRNQEDARRSQLRAETERVRSSLLSAVSHDLKTPLAAIMGSASEVLRSGRLEKTAGSLVENIRDEAERLARLVHNLIETTRLDSGVELRKESLPLEEVLGSALEGLARRLGARPVRTDLPEDLPLVPVDAVLLQQVFVNLIENALLHAPGAAPIEISARRDGASVSVEVADRGPGLPADDLAKVFDKFYRGSTGGGAGLGLAICRAIVEAHGGRIEALNRDGGGAVFRFRLPLGEKS